MSADRAPKGVESGEISTVEAAHRLGLTSQAIGQWCKKPGAPIRKKGTRVYVKWPDFARWREQLLLKEAKGESPEGTFARRMQAANARASEIRLAREEIELAKAQGSVVDVRDVEDVTAKILDRLMAMLRTFSARFSELGPHAEEVIDREVERLIEQLHAFDEDLLDEPAGDDDDADDEQHDEAA